MEISEDDRRAATRLAIEAARSDLLSFILLLNPHFCVGPHHRLICNELMSLERGEIDRLMVALAPRSSKSWIVSICFPAWALGRNPFWQVMEVSHSSDLSTDFGREVRNLISSPTYAAIFPRLEIRKDQRAAGDWGLNFKERAAGHFFSAGAATGIAGKGAHLAVVDDPISEQDAFSKSKRDAVNEWYPGGLRTRLMPGGRIVILQTRWHEDDLSGMLQRQEKENPLSDKWRAIKIPALNTEESFNLLSKAVVELKSQGYIPADYPPLEIGKSFWPQPAWPEDPYFWSTEALIRTKSSTPGYQWDALYMQNPTSPEGGIIKKAYWKNWERKEAPGCEFIISSLDTAFSVRTSADFSAITTWGVFKDEDDNMNVILLGAKKGRWAYPELRKKAIDKYYEHQPDVMLIEKRASGQSLIQDLSLAGLPIREYQPDRDKEARAHSCASLFHNGRVWAPFRKSWAMEVIEECRTFPSGQHDDYVDATTQAILWVRNSGWLEHTESPWKDYEKNAIIRSNNKVFY